MWSGIRRVVYACSGDELDELAGDILSIRSRDVLFTCSQDHMVEVVGPFLQGEAHKVHEEYGWGRKEESERNF